MFTTLPSRGTMKVGILFKSLCDAQTAGYPDPCGQTGMPERRQVQGELGATHAGHSLVAFIHSAWISLAGAVLLGQTSTDCENAREDCQIRV